ncbi:hypothetical protein AVEN_146292-1 [Araneus ventricosus]|uniref:DUF4817 domain-containing protein n=1 Tax=Araneus ventricosus TaxID=182803 RepID=A0A4Y2HM35_ARAVE|nr:hypothetical protein AVEN_146292-1 [Araneus ventricosus]
MTVSLKDCALLIKLFHKNNDCAPVALQKFRTLKGMKKGVGPMTVQGLLKMIQKFEKTGSFAVRPGRGRKRIDSTVVEEVATAVQEESSGGVQPCRAREIARTLDRPVSTVQKILRNILHCYPYKISHVQELFPSDLPARDFCFKISCSHGIEQ